MTLQERLLASAKELVRLLEESQKEHEEMIQERDRKLLGEWDNSAEEIKLPGRLGLILYVDAKSREVMGFEVSLPDGSAFQPPIDKLYKAIEAMTPPCLKIDGAEMHKAACREAEQREAAPIHIAVDHEYKLPYLSKEDSIRKHAASQILDALQEAFSELSFELETLLHDTRNVRAEQVMRDFAFELKVDIQKSRVCIRIDQEIDGN